MFTTPSAISRLALAAALLLGACTETGTPAAARAAAVCAPGAGPVELRGTVTSADAGTYLLQPFEVRPGTGRIELGYAWQELPGPPGTPATATTLDLGLWDTAGYRDPAGFRGWGGSRQGRMDRNQPPVFIEATRADRGFLPGRIDAGLWYAELGVGAVSPQGAEWQLQLECKTAPDGRLVKNRVDARHVARFAPGWYHGDFHMHGYHSHPEGPGWDDFVLQARAAGLDFLMVTEYVTSRHWDTLGSLQAAHPDLILWPGREIITYKGHVNTHGETFDLVEYRHGFEDVDLGLIQREARARGALFQVNHPTFFPPPAFSNFCRGCYFELGDVIDWDLVDTIEILTGPVLATGADIGAPVPGQVENPFLQTALDLWDELLMRGHKITAVSGSDSKGVETTPAERQRRGYGSSATAVHAAELSRPALTAAIRQGRAYVRTRGVAASPALEFLARGPGGDEVTFGGALALVAGETAWLRSTVTGGSGQTLAYIANGKTVLSLPVTSDPFVHELQVGRLPGEGPLGTFWRIETRDAQTRTAIGNPVFLQAP